MDNLHVLASLSVESSLHRTAYSALPDAPVQPVVARHRPLHALHTAVRAIVAHRARRECDTAVSTATA